MINSPILFNNVSKTYSISRYKYGRLSEDLGHFFQRIVLRERKTLQKEKVWAVRGLSFDVKKGTTLGLIGRNGSGKSTILKLISRITYPDSGQISVRGRIGAFIELGAGLHPELTGRENIYLNGVIIGMSRANIKRKFDSIVSFSGIEKFIDTQVKFYSSGMHTRLAFSVASHIDSDILIVDEVLSVGDYEFQKKSLDKISSISKQGRTILFVSHSLQAVSSLCDRIILLEEGRLIEDGKTQDVLKRYLGTTVKKKAFKTWTDLRTAPGNDFVKLNKVSIKDIDGKIKQNIDIRNNVEIEMEYRVLKSGISLYPSIEIFNETDIPVFTSNDTEFKWNNQPRAKGNYISSVIIPGNLLSGGEYRVRTVIGTLKPYQKHISQFDVVRFNIIDMQGTDTARGNYAGTIPGVVRPILAWKTYFHN